MTLRKFPSKLYCKVFGTGETVSPGGFTLAQAQQLQYVRLLIYKHGACAGTEQFRLKVYADSALTKLVTTSAWSSFASDDASAIRAASYWLGFLRFDFAKEWLPASQAFYLALESTGYTRNGNTFYVGGILDWPLSIYTQSQSPKFSFAMEIYGYRKVGYE